MSVKSDIIIGIDAGTSVMKAVAFSLDGQQLATSSIKNTYDTGPNGAMTQSLKRTWADCATALRGLGEKIEYLGERAAALSVTAQGDGTWLLSKDGSPLTDAWIWLDSRAASTVEELVTGPLERERFLSTGTGLNTCQQSAHLAHMARHHPELLENAGAALHCKDWLYYCLTGEIATDPSEASFSFGDFRTRQYSDVVIEALGLSAHRHLLPQIVDGAEITHPLSAQAAAECGLKQGTPVSLGFVDMVMTALGAGVYTGEAGVACSTIGSTGVHMKAVKAADVQLGDQHTGYAICLPHEDIVAQTQTNMAATLNIDWILEVGAGLVSEFAQKPSHADMIAHLDRWLSHSTTSNLIYHPYISEAGERGPFVNAQARASFTGLSTQHKFADMARAVVEGLGLAARDCYRAMGDLPKEVRITGGAARSEKLQNILSACLHAPVRVSARDEAGAAAAAMMACVANRQYTSMTNCIDDWVTPLLEDPQSSDPALSQTYDAQFEIYKQTRENLEPVWDLADTSQTRSTSKNKTD